MLKLLKKLKQTKAKKRKIPILQLTQSGNDRPVLIGELRDGEEAMATGAMGGCVSAILLWDRDPATGEHRQVRGQHGSGGREVLDWQRLLQGVPQDGSATLIVSMQDIDKEFVERDLSKKFASEGYRLEFVASSNLVVHRDGRTEDYGGPTFGSTDYEDRFEIRKESLPRR